MEACTLKMEPCSGFRFASIYVDQDPDPPIRIKVESRIRILIKVKRGIRIQIGIKAMRIRSPIGKAC
jgi:hypothetical protein